MRKTHAVPNENNEKQEKNHKNTMIDNHFTFILRLNEKKENTYKI